MFVQFPHKYSVLIIHIWEWSLRTQGDRYLFDGEYKNTPSVKLQ